MAIHPKAIISKSVKIGKNVEVGPYTIIDNNSIIQDNVFIDAHVKIGPFTTIGHNSRVYFNAVVGGEPQDHNFDPGVKSYTEIGSDTVIKEFVTIHRSPKEEFKTIIGNHCMLMAFVHVAHDGIIGDRVTIVNHSSMSGHVEIGSGATISGYNLFHQFCRIGTLAMVGPGHRINLDIPPYCLLGDPGYIFGINTIGLRRAGIDMHSRAALKKAVRTYFFQGHNRTKALEIIEEDKMTPEIKHFVEFIKSSKRGIVPAIRKRVDINEE